MSLNTENSFGDNTVDLFPFGTHWSFPNLFFWAETKDEPLRSHAIGILSTAMSNENLVHKYFKENNKLVPLILKKLKKLQEEPQRDVTEEIARSLDETSLTEHILAIPQQHRVINVSWESIEKPFSFYHYMSYVIIQQKSHYWDEINREYSSNDYQLPTLLPSTQEIIILRYLAAIGKYKEYLNHALKHNAFQLIFNTICVQETKDDAIGKFAKEALKYLASLLHHKQFFLQFLDKNGFEMLWSVSKKSDPVMSGVSLCCYRLAQSEDIMERVCSLPKSMITTLVKYLLSMLEQINNNDSTDSPAYYASQFLSLTFSYKVILEEFEAQGGLQKFSIIPVIFKGHRHAFEYFGDYPKTYIFEYIVNVLKSYLETCLYLRLIEIEKCKNVKFQTDTSQSPIPHYKWHNELSSEDIQRLVKFLQEFITDFASWPIMHEFYTLNIIKFLLEFPVYIHRQDQQKYAITHRDDRPFQKCFEILAICAVVPEIRLMVCTDVQILPMEPILLMIASIYDERARRMYDADTCQAVLRLLDNCVCAPINDSYANRELIQKVCDNIQHSNGTWILFRIIRSRPNRRDNTELRLLASKALLGLLRSEKARSNLHPLSIFSAHKIQTLIDRSIKLHSFKDYLIFEECAQELMDLLLNTNNPISFESNVTQDYPQSSNKKSTAGKNIVTEIFNRQVGSDMIIKKYRGVYSKFCPIKKFVGEYKSCIFSADEKYLTIGTSSGEVIKLNINTGIEETRYECSSDEIIHLETNKMGNLLLTTSSYCIRSNIALWDISESFEKKLVFDETEYVNFSRHDDKLITTTDRTASIHDIYTGQVIQTIEPSISNYYKLNRATFSIDDKLVLNDGVLWDVNSNKFIHKFEKFSDYLNGIFHPNGLEVTFENQVWDLRMFDFIKDIPRLTKRRIIFSPTNHIIYSLPLESLYEKNVKSRNSFETLNPTDYSHIVTYDSKNRIFDFACNKIESQIALIQDQENSYEPCVRLYDIGRQKNEEEEILEDTNDRVSEDSNELYWGREASESDPELEREEEEDSDT